MVNLLGSDARRRPAVDLARDLSPPARTLLEARRAEVARFYRTLAPTLPLARRARTPELEPELEEASSVAAVEAALALLAARRAALASARAPVAAPADASPIDAAPRGRLLLCELDLSLGRGEAEAASQGLFDVDDRPPWDLWLVALGRTRASQPDEPIVALIAWLPEAWFALADAGVRACPSHSLGWLD